MIKLILMACAFFKVDLLFDIVYIYNYYTLLRVYNYSKGIFVCDGLVSL